MRHVEIARAASLRGDARSDIARRLTGRFYTPPILVNRLVDQVVDHCSAGRIEPESVGDPFGGDGRLIVAWLRKAAPARQLSRLRRIALYDYDEAALAEARQRVMAVLHELDLSSQITVFAQAGDTFDRAAALAETLALILTNPPWELLKPDARDGSFTEVGWKDQLRAYAAKLSRDFPGAASQRGKAMAGYGVNLARAGAIAACGLLQPGGILALVLPSSLFADQASAPFRESLLGRVRLSQLDWYPAEARLFAGVDQPLVTLIGQRGSATERYRLVRFGTDLKPLDARNVEVAGRLAQPVALALSGEAAAIVSRIAQLNAPLEQLQRTPRLRLWLGREIDETRLREALCDSASGVPFLKGRHVFPYAIVRDKIWFIDPKKRRIPATVAKPRLAWRDVSRPNQRRRMHVALVPPGNVTGNSLGVAYFQEQADDCITLLMAIMNSFVFELQVRANLATAHVSQGVLRRCAVPLGCFEDPQRRESLRTLVATRLDSQTEQPQLEAAIAREYGLSRDEFAGVLDAFPKLTAAERRVYMDSF